MAERDKEIVEEEAYDLQVAGDRLRRSSLPEEMIHADSDNLVGRLDILMTQELLEAFQAHPVPR